MIAEFTTLVGLIATYKQLREGREAKDEQSFKDWLAFHKFESLSEQIARSHDLNVELNDLLRLDHSDIMDKLKTIEDVVLSVSQRLEGFRGVATMFPETETISDQAIAILKALDNSQTGTGVLLEHLQEYSIMPLPQGQEMIVPSENRFFRDDIEQLVGLGWLTVVAHTDRGRPKLQVTRTGSRAAKQTNQG